MHFLDLTLATAAENLALDEALLDAAESDVDAPREVLRLWKPRQWMVVAGNSSRLADEVHLDVCRQREVPIFRRASGGAAIVTGPGCLMYAVVLSYKKQPELRSVDRAHGFVLNTISNALNRLLQLCAGSAGAASVQRAGISDLIFNDRKVSGNSLRCKRHHFLYHGTLLYQFPLHEIGALLKMPPRQPDYRQQRKHADFVTNLPLDAAQLKSALIDAFHAHQPLADWPRKLATDLVAEKYSRLDWNQRL